jgi:hypothetical protein
MTPLVAHAGAVCFGADVCDWARADVRAPDVEARIGTRRRT